MIFPTSSRIPRKRSLAIASLTRWNTASSSSTCPTLPVSRYSTIRSSRSACSLPSPNSHDRSVRFPPSPTPARSSSFSSSPSFLFTSDTAVTLPRGKDRTPLSSLLRVGSSPTLGTAVFSDWTVDTIETIKDLDIDIYILRHIPTSAIYLHMDTEDIHNYFAVSFRTPTTNSHGVPHVLEHTTLCGSEQYDVKDPFHCMTKRSLGTDMNAVTSADHTSYHFSTTNTQDFHNLLQVFLDATFFPKLRRSDFQQEGIRIEPENLQNDIASDSSLIFRGVVYNEMKGYMANASEHISRALYAALFPGTTYAHSHGGDPNDIPLLTYDELLQFYRQHYSLSNTFFVSYGDMNPLYHIDTIEKFVIQRKSNQRNENHRVSTSRTVNDQRYKASLHVSSTDLARFNHVKDITSIPLIKVRVPPTGADAPNLQSTAENEENEDLEPPLDSLHSRTASPLENVTPVSVPDPAVDNANDSSLPFNENNGSIYLRAWGTCSSNHSYHVLLLRIISDLLVNGTDAPLYRLLIHNGLASHFAPGTGLDSTTVQSVLLFGAAGIQESKTEAIDAAILNSIRYAIEPSLYTHHPDYQGINDPFSPARVCAIIHQMELALRMRNPSYGSILANAVTEQWAHHAENILDGLYVNKLLQRLKKELHIPESTTQVPDTINSELLRNILKQYTLDNSHNVRIIGTPDDNLPIEFQQQEQHKLEKINKEWTLDMRKQAAEEAISATQRSRGNIHTLPGLSVAAVSKKSPISDRVEHTLIRSLRKDMKGKVFGVPLQTVTENCNGISTLRLLLNLQLPSNISLMKPNSSSVSSSYHPWYTASRQQYWSRLDDSLHPWLGMFCGFTAYGTKDRSPHEWETAIRLTLGGISVSVMNASPTLLPGLSSEIIQAHSGLHNLVPYNNKNDPSFLTDNDKNNQGLLYSTPPLYGIAIETSWLSDRTKDAIPLLTELLTSSAVLHGLLQTRDRSLLTQAIRSAAVENAMHLTENGASYAKLLASSSMNPLSALRELQGGMHQARLIEYLHALGEDGITLVANELETLTRSVFALPYSTETDTVDRVNKEFTDLLRTNAQYGAPAALRFPLRAMFTSDKGKYQNEGIDGISDLVNKLPLKEFSLEKSSSSKPESNSASKLTTVSSLTTETNNGTVPSLPVAAIPPVGYRAIINVPTTVHSLSVVLPGPPWGTESHAYVSILCSLLSSTHLHESIRERGGAYDVSGRIGTNDDIVFSTGEDPVPFESIQRIKEGGLWASEGKFTLNDLDEAKLSVFAQLDAPVAPSSIGLSPYLYGVTSTARQMYRDWIFKATKEDIQRVAKEYIVKGLETKEMDKVDGEKVQNYNTIVAGPAEQFKGDTKEWKIINILNNESEHN